MSEPTTAGWTPAALHRLVERCRRLLKDPHSGHFISSVAWSALSLGGERAITLLQAFFIARTLGIELFGKYGLVFTTIGLVSSVAGLQLGLTASVHVAKDVKTNPARAAAAMRMCELVSFVLAAACALALVAEPGRAAHWLLGSAEHADVIVAGALIALLSIVSGVQEGILQGLEQFSQLSVARVATSIAGLALLVVTARPGDLGSVIAAVAMAVFLRAGVLMVIKERVARRLGLKADLAGIWEMRRIILSFSLPSVLVSLVSGVIGWYGLYMLGRAPGGFSEVAFVTAAQQWRGLVLLATAVLASVAVPMMSRLSAEGDAHSVRRVHRLNGAANIAVAVLVSAVVIAGSGFILATYGDDFVSGRLVFALVMITTMPAVYIVVQQNYLVSHGRMWEQLWYSLAQSVPLLAAYWYAVPRFGAVGFAVATLVVTLTAAVLMHVLVAMELKRACEAPGRNVKPTVADA